MEGRLKESVGVVRGHLGGEEVDREVADLGLEISGPGGFVPASLAEELIAELIEAREEVSRLEGRRVEVTEAVHPTDLNVLDTSELFGREEVALKRCRSGAIDERNLVHCRTLFLDGSQVRRLGTRFLENLAHLSIGEAKITELDTAPLKGLQVLKIYETGISSLGTSSLGSLRVLIAYKTELASLDTRPLTSLRKIDVSGTRMGALDTRPLGKVEQLWIYSTRIRFIASRLASLGELSTHGTRIAKVHVIPGWRFRGLQIDGSGIRFLDGRARLQVRDLGKDGSQTVAYDRWVGE